VCSAHVRESILEMIPYYAIFTFMLASSARTKQEDKVLKVLIKLHVRKISNVYSMQCSGGQSYSYSVTELQH
jgi:hypothetical protein